MNIRKIHGNILFQGGKGKGSKTILNLKRRQNIFFLIKDKFHIKKKYFYTHRGATFLKCTE